MNILEKNLLILASAGSGKTFQLGNRVIGLVVCGVPPERIVALTFTRKAAGEFADSVLTKLANAADNEQVAENLRQELAQPDADFEDALERVVRALPRLTLSTMDSFFAKIVRGFQYELGLIGGKFDLLEGPRAAAMADDMLAGILGDQLDEKQGEAFLHAFRRATYGREDQGVIQALREFVRQWHGRFQESKNQEWGPAEMAHVLLDQWEKQKSGLADCVLRCLDGIQYTRKDQQATLEKEVAKLENHVIGGGSLSSKVSSLMTSIFDACASTSGSLTVKHYNEFVIGGPAADALREMVNLASRCEFSAALQRTRAVREVISAFDELCTQRLRRRGMLSFNDVKILMGAWAHSEDARLRREAVDFRLDSRIDHWLLDEFQDTSRADWAGLEPLVDEAVTGENGTMFIVGDKKQAIYAWRGGDVGLFDDVISRYGAGLKTAPMNESWRSCPEVLALVNQVCGDISTLRELFGEAAGKWAWDNHFSARPLLDSSKSGESRVEVVGDWEQRLERLQEILNELAVGKRKMTCGILLRGNQRAREVADYLRSKDFDVIEEGRRQPASDNPVGITITHLLKWLANPADAYAREIVEMSPLAANLRITYGEPWWLIWDGLTATLSKNGFSHTISKISTQLWENGSYFSRRRMGDLLSALATFDQQGGVSIQEAADLLERLEISQSPGVAAVQVMTIHKSKGLGFDVVILPEIPDDGIPQSQYFDVAEGNDWLTETPPKWARSLIPELRDAELQWAEKQRYEAFCMLYVALTRAKRGLYVLLDTPKSQPKAKKSEPPKSSLASWLKRSVDAEDREGLVYQTGISGWAESFPPLPPSHLAANAAPTQTPIAILPRTRFTPTGTHPVSSSLPRNSTHLAELPSFRAMQLGYDVHALLEQVSWLDDGLPNLPATEAGHLVAKLLQNPALDPIFFRRGRNLQLFREQGAIAILDGQILSGVIDRLHLEKNSQGIVSQVFIIDFKTDSVKHPDELIKRYAAQMSAYRSTMEKIYPSATITCTLVSIRHCQLMLIP